MALVRVQPRLPRQAQARLDLVIPFPARAPPAVPQAALAPTRPPVLARPPLVAAPTLTVLRPFRLSHRGLPSPWPLWRVLLPCSKREGMFLRTMECTGLDQDLQDLGDSFNGLRTLVFLSVLFGCIVAWLPVATQLVMSPGWTLRPISVLYAPFPGRFCGLASTALEFDHAPARLLFEYVTNIYHPPTLLPLCDGSLRSFSIRLGPPRINEIDQQFVMCIDSR